MATIFFICLSHSSFDLYTLTLSLCYLILHFIITPYIHVRSKSYFTQCHSMIYSCHIYNIKCIDIYDLYITISHTTTTILLLWGISTYMMKFEVPSFLSKMSYIIITFHNIILKQHNISYYVSISNFDFRC